MYKKISLFLVGIVCACFLAACSEKSSQNEEKIEEPSGMVVAISSSQSDYYSGVIERYRKSHPETEINIVTLPDNENASSEEVEKNRKIVEDMQVQVMAGKGPDLFILDEKNTLFPDLIKNCYSGTFLDLHTVMSDLEEFPISPVIAKAGEIEGKQYFLPLGYSIFGVAVPEEMLDDWEPSAKEPYDFMNEIKNRAGVSQMPKEYILKWAAAGELGESFLDYEGKKVVFGNEWKEWIQYISEQESGTGSDDTFPDVIQLGHYMVGADESRLSRMLASENELSFLPIPNGKDGVNAQINVFATIRANSSFGKEAGELCEFMLSDEMQKTVSWKSAGNSNVFTAIPVNRNALETVFTKRLANATQEGHEEEIAEKVNELLEVTENITSARFVEHENMLIYMAIDKMDRKGTNDKLFEELEHELRFYFDE